MSSSVLCTSRHTVCSMVGLDFSFNSSKTVYDIWQYYPSTHSRHFFFPNWIEEKHKLKPSFLQIRFTLRATKKHIAPKPRPSSRGHIFVWINYFPRNVDHLLHKIGIFLFHFAHLEWSAKKLSFLIPHLSKNIEQNNFQKLIAFMKYLPLLFMNVNKSI